MLVLGVDPGLNGAAGIVDMPADPLLPPTIVAVIDLPTSGESTKRRIHVGEFFGWLKTHAPERGFIERAQSMPQQGVASTFRYGRAVGHLEASCLCAGIKMRELETRAWKKHFGLDSDKEKSRALVQSLYPDSKLFERVMDHQRAEAVLIACYGVHALRAELR